jgi:hypothetical protein
MNYTVDVCLEGLKRLQSGRGSRLQVEQSAAWQAAWLPIELLIALFKEETAECVSVQQNGDGLYQVIQQASLYITDGKHDHECLMARRH